MKSRAKSPPNRVLQRTALLTIDGAINLLLGVLLIAFPNRLVDWLGVPSSASHFYPNILGGVLLGVGIALILERRTSPNSGLGLGLGGAVAINLCGGLVLGAWLLFGSLSLPIRGFVLLWLLVAVLVGISIAEIINGAASKRRLT